MQKNNIIQKFELLCNTLKQEQNKNGFWTGKLASSALATAVATVALTKYNYSSYQSKITTGINWLIEHQNNDGGFGDTPESTSNVSTSLLCYASLKLCKNLIHISDSVIIRIEDYLKSQKIDISPEKITKSVLEFYGKDLTFSVPILSMLVICNVLDEKACEKIPLLPFEFSIFPHSWYRFFNMQVVSYAIPALVAVGIYIFKKRKKQNIILKLIKNKAIKPAIKRLSHIMPESGGFLEAIPLTGFVNMCLVESNFRECVVVEKGIHFLINQQRADGSWPIDTDLSTWVTTLTIKALNNEITTVFQKNDIDNLKAHLLNIQYKEKHSFNKALPGGWGWTNYSGSVPDADDTSGAILALIDLYTETDNETKAILNGCKWLSGIQNSDDGMPTFCKGWGRLPFDSSCADLSGHALLAWISSLHLLKDKIKPKDASVIKNSIKNIIKYLKEQHHNNGSWEPLWFGNQLTDNKKNPVYGTAKVAVYLSDCLKMTKNDLETDSSIKNLLQNAQNYLIKQQNPDGSWGGKLGIEGTIEETSLAISALVHFDKVACLKGFEWLEKYYNENGPKSSPIGLYFAALWYDEKMYPLAFYIEALRRFKNL